MHELAEGAPCRICGTPITDVLLVTEKPQTNPFAHAIKYPGRTRVTVEPCGHSWWLPERGADA